MTYASTTGAVALTSAVIIVAAMSVRGGAHPTGAVTWSTVSRVLDERCLSCHGPGGGAAPRLDGYEHARLAADDMKRAVLERRMPPWYAVEGFGDFAGNPTLTQVEATWLADWADAGAPDDPAGGEVSDLPAEAGSQGADQAGSGSADLPAEAGSHGGTPSRKPRGTPSRKPRARASLAERGAGPADPRLSDRAAVPHLCAAHGADARPLGSRLGGPAGKPGARARCRDRPRPWNDARHVDGGRRDDDAAGRRRCAAAARLDDPAHAEVPPGVEHNGR